MRGSKYKYKMNLSMKFVLRSKYQNFERFFINNKDLFDNMSWTQVS